MRLFWQLLLVVIFPISSLAEQLVISQFGKEKFLLYLPLYTAMEEGLFEKRGIEVKLKFVGNDDQIFASVMSGEADIGVGDPVFAAIAGEKGFPGRVIAEMVKKIGLTGVTKGDVNVKAPKDLAGKRICSFPAPSTTYTLLTEMIRKSDVRNTKIVQVAMGSQLAALSAKQCEIALDLEPSVTNAESKGFVAEFPFDRFNDVMTITGFQTTQKVIDEKGELLKKAVSALQEALLLLEKDREAALRTTRKIFPQLADAVVNKAVKRMYELDVYPKSVFIEQESWGRTIKTRIDSGEMKSPPRDTVYNGFAEAAATEFGIEARE